jgi:MFS family permease
MALSHLLNIRLVALLRRNPNFAIFSAGNAVALVGMWMERIAVGWLAWQLTESGFWLGVVAFADFFPVVVIGPIAGAFADRLDRLRVVQVSQSLLLLQAGVLTLLTATGFINIWLLVALTAVHGVVVAFNQPARLALIPSLVGPGDVAAAVAVNSVFFNLARFIGPILAGLAIVASGVAMAFLINTLSYVAYLVALARIRAAPEEVKPSAPRGLWADVGDGIRYAATHPGIAAVLFLGIAIGVGGRPLSELLPGIADDVFRSGAAGLSILASAMGGGAILGGLWLSHRAHASGLTAVAVVSAAVGAVAGVATIATDRLWLAVPAIAVCGFCTSASGISIQTLVQLAADRAMRGRVMGLYGLIFRGAPAVGALAAGLASATFGLRWPVVFGAVAVLAVGLWTYLHRARIAAALEQSAQPP